MKKKIVCLFILSSFFLPACEDDFLNRYPLDQLIDETYWTNENNVRTYAWGFYTTYFPGYGSSYTTGGSKHFSRQSLNDDFAPSTPVPFPNAVPTSGGGWNFAGVRKANLFTDRVKTVPMAEEAIKHWQGIGRFFRAMEYADLVNSFGDVPFFGDVPAEDSPELYQPRDPRTVVMDSVLADFTYAAENVRESDNTTGPKGLIVNRYVVLAFMSRIFLFEGTWQKYHDGDPAKAVEYLEAAKWAANEVITSGEYNVGNDYRALFSSLDLSSNPEVIMYRAYESAQVTHTVMSMNNNATQQGASKDVIETYLASDGLPVSISTVYQGDQTIADVMTDRDPRINATFAGELRLAGRDANHTTTGYASQKFLNESLKNDQNLGFLDKNITDAPIIRFGEVLVNYAEAAAELGTLTQGDLDLSINRLRDRAGVNMPHLEVMGGLPAVNGATYDDPARDQTVSPLLWEIRRERRVELIFEGFRLDDLRRWGKLEYTDTQENIDINRGAWIDKSDYPGINSSVELTGGTTGYVIPSPTVQRTFSDPKFYLNPLPLDQITLYSDQGAELTQNPGW